MKKLILTLLISVAGINSFAQQAFYDVIAANGNGVRFWQNDNWKIHMGNLAEYHYGPVNDYSIKMNMDNNNNNSYGRGWTWGTSGATPVAAMNVLGNMQIAGGFTTGSDIQIASASIPMGFATEVGGTTPLLNMNVNFRGSNVNSTYHGASFRIDTRTNSQLFQWLARPAGVPMGTGENILMSLMESGFLGIGMTTPAYSLDVNGTVRSNANLRTTAVGNGNGYIADDGSGNTIFSITRQPNNETRFQSYGYHTFYSGNSTGSERMRIAPNGYVGIGTSSPDALLAVSGQVHAQEVKVSITVPGPDYVFANDYKLTSLKEIEAYIDRNKHLPEVPSAKEMEKNGVQLGEMNMLLLKKIEELTLYVIEQKNEIQELRAELKEIKK
jgi:hypothetical protein